MKKIDAVEMVRNIRDQHSKDITGKSPKEIIDYFRSKAGRIAQKVRTEELRKR